MYALHHKSPPLLAGKPRLSCRAAVLVKRRGILGFQPGRPDRMSRADSRHRDAPIGRR
jgi:hypothetical protein